MSRYPRFIPFSAKQKQTVGLDGVVDHDIHGALKAAVHELLCDWEGSLSTSNSQSEELTVDHTELPWSGGGFR